MCPEMMQSMSQMTPQMMYGMAAFIGIRLAFGLALLAGTFYFIWRLVKALENIALK
ncbi:MAG: hypothetical protein LPK26_09040 [Bacillaceae bacterium]|nr:hypothetical protein [Bacillaceae bacterium]